MGEQRFWEDPDAEKVGKVVDDLIESNVLEALNQFIAEAGAWSGVDDGKVIITVSGPKDWEKPADENGVIDGWYKEFNLVEVIGSPGNGLSLEELNVFADTLQKLADRYRKAAEERANVTE